MEFCDNMLTNLVSRAWKWQLRNSCTSTVQFLLPVCPTNKRHQNDYILDQRAKFGENW